MHTTSLVKVVQPLLAAALFACGCGSSTATKTAEVPARVGLESPAFAAGGAIPRRFTCDGADVSPPLRFASVPRQAAELALVVDDPDAPGGDFTHWVLFHVDPHTRSLAADSVPVGARQGRNGFGQARYGGPCPPVGAPAHRYVFTLYALGRALALPDGAAATQVRSAIAGSETAVGQLVARYGR